MKKYFGLYFSRMNLAFVTYFWADCKETPRDLKAFTKNANLNEHPKRMTTR